MGLSHKSHGNRTDKETQSPMLKIFKDMMKKEKRDPEKTTLLKEKHHDRKRKHYSGSRSKSGRVQQIQTVSSSSEHQNIEREPYKMSKQDALTAQFEVRNSQVCAAPAEVKKSTAEDTCSCVSCALRKMINTDYACIGCITILLIVSVIIAISLVYKSMPCGTKLDQDLQLEKITDQKMESDRLKRKIGTQGKWSFGPKKQWQNIFRRNDYPDMSGFSLKMNDMSSLVESENELSKILDFEKLNEIRHSDRLREFYKKLVQTDAAIRNLRKSITDSYTNTNLELNSHFDLNNNFDTSKTEDISKSDDIGKSDDISKSDDINKNYEYKSKIDYSTKSDFEKNLDVDRLKRSINFNHGRLFHFKRKEPGVQSKVKNGKLFTKSTINMTSQKKPDDNDDKDDNKVSRNKRFGNYSEEGLIIEKNKVMIQFKPSRVVAKCSHSPKDSKSHENDLNHPFYKNSQRLDELLDQFIDKKLPDLLADRLKLGMLFDKTKNKPCKHPVTEEFVIIKDEDDDDPIKNYDQSQKNEIDQKENEGKDYPNQNSDQADQNRSNNKLSTNKYSNKGEQPTAETSAKEKETPKLESKDVKHSANAFENDFLEDSDGVEKANARSSAGGYDILLSVSTSVNPPIKKSTFKSTTPMPVRPNLRKLMQMNIHSEDGVAYEDLKDVLADYNEGNDEEEKKSERTKRNDKFKSNANTKNAKQHSSSVHNPNWKGPMPLYPDELTQALIKSQKPESKIQIPRQKQNSISEIDYAEPVRTDVQYVEDYLGTGYDKLVELAQAYSDYGVLDGKKGSTGEKKEDNMEKEHKVESRRDRMFENRMKKHASKRGLKNNNLLGMLKHGRSISEGIRIEFQSSTTKSTDSTVHTAEDVAGMRLKEIFNKHLKLGPTATNTKSLEESIPEISNDVEVDDITLPDTATVKHTQPEIQPQTQLHTQPQEQKESKIQSFDLNTGISYKTRNLKSFDVLQSNESETFDENLNVLDMLSGINKETEKKNAASDETSDGIASKKTLNISSSKSDVQVILNNMGAKTKIVSSSHMDKSKRNSTARAKFNSNTRHTNRKAHGNATLSDFCMLLSRWFSALGATEVTAKNKTSVTPSENHHNTPESQLVYPAYDSETFEEVGHKSRKLLSVEMANKTKQTERLTSEDETSQFPEVSSSTEPMNKENYTSIQDTTSAKKLNAVSNNTNNRLVKRQAIEDSNLIFWNDLYDEEYGINADPIENNIRDKHSVEKNDEGKKSTWLQNKVKQIAERFHQGGGGKGTKIKPTINESKHVKRSIQYDINEDDIFGKLDLSALTDRMKAVCKETVQAVQDMKYIQVHEENRKEGHAASTLMQQLVRLMTDLVDYQVHERTCRKLPPDLQTFLEWLTSSNEEDTDVDSFARDRDNIENMVAGFTSTTVSNKLDKPTTEQDLLLPSENENTDSKTDCLGTLQAIQNLIREYEEMTEDDKSIMTGVRNYLENQMQFLKQQLTLDDLKNLNRESRSRRDLMSDIGHTVSTTMKQTAQQIEKQYQNLKKMYCDYKNKLEPTYKKATKTTAEAKQAVTDMVHKITEPKPKPCKPCKLKPQRKELISKFRTLHKNVKVQTKNEKYKFRKLHKLGKFAHKNKEKADEKSVFDIEKNLEEFEFSTEPIRIGDKIEKNIKGVYYRAVEEAKKLTSLSGYKEGSETFDKTDIFRVNDYVGERPN